MVAGSQNGFDNSGRRGDVHWVSEDYPQDNANVARTIIIQDKIAANMARWIEEGAFKRETLYGISLLNEPAGWWDKVCLLEIVDCYSNARFWVWVHILVNLVAMAFLFTMFAMGLEFYLVSSKIDQRNSLQLRFFFCFGA